MKKNVINALFFAGSCIGLCVDLINAADFPDYWGSILEIARVKSNGYIEFTAVIENLEEEEAIIPETERRKPSEFPEAITLETKEEEEEELAGVIDLIAEGARAREERVIVAKEVAAPKTPIERALQTMRRKGSIEEGFLDLYIDIPNVTEELLIARLVGIDAFPTSLANESSAKKIVTRNPKSMRDLEFSLSLLKRSGRDDLFITEKEACDLVAREEIREGFFEGSIYHLNLFFLLRSIRSINFSENVKNIEPDMLSMFLNLTKVSFDHGSRLSKGRIPDRAFRNCSKLREIVLSDNVRAIKKGACENCTNLVTISHNELIKVRSKTHSGKRNKSHFVQIVKQGFPHTLLSVGPRAFKNCASLRNVDLSNTCIRFLEKGVFDGCGKLQSLILPHSIQAIFNAFEDCDSLAFIQALEIDRDYLTVIPEVTIPIVVRADETVDPQEKSFSMIANGLNPRRIIALSNQLMLQNIIGRDCRISLDLREGMIFENDTNQTANLPFALESAVSVIETGDFANFLPLASVVIHPEIAKIQPCAFKNCRFLTSVAILSEETKVAVDAFFGCSLLKEITIGGRKVEVRNGVIMDRARRIEDERNYIPYYTVARLGVYAIEEEDRREAKETDRESDRKESHKTEGIEGNSEE